MKKCSLTIITCADGQETNFSCEAEMELSPLSASLHYIQDGGDTVISFAERKVTIQRTGDYSILLNLEEGIIREGKLSIGSNDGNFQVISKKVSYAITDKSLLASFHYQLLFEGGTQDMKLRLNAREIYSEEK